MRSRKIILRTALILLMCLGLTACNLPANRQPNYEAMQQTSVVMTVDALKTQIAVESTPSVPQIATNTAQPLPSETPTATTAPTITATPEPSYRAGNVIDVTYADNTVVKPGESFTKTWKLTNMGTGTWTPNFKLVFISGDAMGAPASKAIGKTVAPGQSVELSVSLVAPSTPKTYQGKWMLQTESGTNFGIGENAAGTFWVKVVVQDTFAITNAVLSTTVTDAAASCPATVTVKADITAKAAGTATYYFITSLGNSPTYSSVFTAAGTLTSTTYTFQVPSTQDVTLSLYNDQPNHQEFGVKTITVTCVP